MKRVYREIWNFFHHSIAYTGMLVVASIVVLSLFDLVCYLFGAFHKMTFFGSIIFGLVEGSLPPLQIKVGAIIVVLANTIVGIFVMLRLLKFIR